MARYMNNSTAFITLSVAHSLYKKYTCSDRACNWNVQMLCNKVTIY